MEVVFEVIRRRYPLDETAAMIFAENLEHTAAGERGDQGVEGAASLARAIRDVLDGRSSDPILLGGEEAESAFYVLDVSVDPSNAQHFALYEAVRTLHRAHVERGSG
jgi:hypothetical protein